MDNDVIDLIAKRKIPVFVIEEDLAARGIERRTFSFRSAQAKVWNSALTRR